MMRKTTAVANSFRETNEVSEFAMFLFRIKNLDLAGFILANCNFNIFFKKAV